MADNKSTDFKLTSHLLHLAKNRDSSAFTRATRHEFLQNAGSLTLDKERLERWLTQDRIYAFVGYPKFISLLISRIPLRANTWSDHPEDKFKSSPSHEERLLAMLSSALTNIVREIIFFRNTAQENGLDVMKASAPDNDDPHQSDITNPITKGYVDFMIATGATGSVLEGLTLLWVTEKCYLEAWSYAKSILHKNPKTSLQHDSAPGVTKALITFINNWSTPEFKAFVDEIGDLLDEHVSKTLSAQGSEGLLKIVELAETIWHWCLWYEERFWDGK